MHRVPFGRCSIPFGSCSKMFCRVVYYINTFNRQSRSLMVRYGDLIQQYEVSLSRMLNDILTLDQQWLPNQSDLSLISWPWYRLWPSPNYEWFPWRICNGCGTPAGNAYPSGHLVPSPNLVLVCGPIVVPDSSMSLLDFSPRIPLELSRLFFAISTTWYRYI